MPMYDDYGTFSCQTVNDTNIYIYRKKESIIKEKKNIFKSLKSFFKRRPKKED